MEVVQSVGGQANTKKSFHVWLREEAKVCGKRHGPLEILVVKKTEEITQAATPSPGVHRWTYIVLKIKERRNNKGRVNRRGKRVLSGGGVRGVSRKKTESPA